MPQQSYKNCFDPVLAPSTRLLILGSLPGEASLSAGQYYAHPRNQFWDLLGHTFDLDLRTLAYQQRLLALQEHGIGLWDIVAKAQRQGSLDSNLREVEHNQFDQLLVLAPALQTIACNGNESWRRTQRLYGAWLEHHHIRLIPLPSSSPAYTMPFSEKLSAWLILRDAV